MGERERNVVRGNESRPIGVAGRIDQPITRVQESGEGKRKGIERKKAGRREREEEKREREKRSRGKMILGSREVEQRVYRVRVLPLPFFAGPIYGASLDYSSSLLLLSSA